MHYNPSYYKIEVMRPFGEVVVSPFEVLHTDSELSKITSPPRTDGSKKWVDFFAAFGHCECVCGLSEKAFTAKYQKWCKKHGYNFSEDNQKPHRQKRRESYGLPSFASCAPQIFSLLRFCAGVYGGQNGEQHAKSQQQTNDFPCLFHLISPFLFLWQTLLHCNHDRVR